ncbi:hypothetical protein L2E82_10966 [Cichorium intybus]|uniref:Uncharacterized protein n=1 Tax=Cichorium intybus TaxID=13427 RepID=A0ACB9GCZ7_CICIN|nr:hypothetical protein L2E82_10966 [Cichorium intybus]
MNYEQRLVAAAKCVFEGDARTAAEAQVNCPDFGVTTTLKPHQIEGLSWLIRIHKDPKSDLGKQDALLE